MTTQPTIEAIETAIRNGDRDITNYTVTLNVAGMYTVQHITNPRRAYTVDTTPGYEHCQCPAFARDGVCKHQYIVAENEKINAEEAKLSDPDFIGYAAK